jgi:hypothetical protein
MSARIEVEADDEYGSVVEAQFSRLVSLLRQDNVRLAPIRSLRDPVTGGIVVAIVGTVGPVLVREKTVREIVRDSHRDHPARKTRPARAIIHHKGKEHVIATGDQTYDTC